MFLLQNVQIAKELYHMPWYLMPVPSQKQVIAVIHRLQNGAVLTIGPLSEIDFSTAATVGDFLCNVIFSAYN